MEIIFCLGVLSMWTAVLHVIPAFVALAAFYFHIGVDAYVPQVIVVGGGVGGIAAAARIASSRQDCEVRVLEKNSMLGGRCGSFDVETPRGTFRHERGPSLLLLKQVYQDLFQDCAASSSERFGLQMKQCVPAYQVVFDDGDSIELGFPSQGGTDEDTIKSKHNSEENASRTKMDEYEVLGSAKWDAYMRATEAFLDCGLPNFIEERFDLLSFPAFLRESLRDGGVVSWEFLSVPLMALHPIILPYFTYLLSQLTAGVAT